MDVPVDLLEPRIEVCVISSARNRHPGTSRLLLQMHTATSH